MAFGIGKASDPLGRRIWWDEAAGKLRQKNISEEEMMRTEADEIRDSLEQVRRRRIRRKPAPEDKLKPLFKVGFERHTTDYLYRPRGWVWRRWCVSNHINAAGYFLMWREGVRKRPGAGRIERDRYMGAKDRSVLVKRQEAYLNKSFPWLREK